MLLSMKILFCRHGESLENARGRMAKVVNEARLTKKGLKQTYAFIPTFKKYGVQKVYYSPKERTKKIGKIIDEKMNIPHKVIPELTERNWGTWGNLSWHEVSKKLDKLSIKKRYEMIPPKGESWKQFEKRLLKTMEKIEAEAEKEGYKVVAIVTHRGSLRALFPILLKKSIKKHREYSTDVGSISVVNKIKNLHYSLSVLNVVPKKGKLIKKKRSKH